MLETTGEGRRPARHSDDGAFELQSLRGPISEPRVTYVTPDTPSDVRQVYRDAVADAFKRCTPMQFTDGLGGALAGRPFAIRYVDNRAF